VHRAYRPTQEGLVVAKQGKKQKARLQNRFQSNNNRFKQLDKLLLAKPLVMHLR
jgi:hypothetical protein